MDKTIGFAGKRPAEVWDKISLTVLMLVWIGFMLQANKSTLLELIMAGLVIGVAIVILGILIFRLLTFSRVFVIEIKPAALQIKYSEIEAHKIKKIFIKGYLKPVIAIKPQGRPFLPYKYCFCFSDQQDQGIQALKEWADQHQIEVLYKRFTRWL